MILIIVELLRGLKEPEPRVCTAVDADADIAEAVREKRALQACGVAVKIVFHSRPSAARGNFPRAEMVLDYWRTIFATFSRVVLLKEIPAVKSFQYSWMRSLAFSSS